jgi:hypothetical protein
MMRSTSSRDPAGVRVAVRWASLKYAGTVMTALVIFAQVATASSASCST